MVSTLSISYIVVIFSDGGLLLRLHQIDVLLVMTHLCQRAGDVGLLKHLEGDGGTGTVTGRSNKVHKGHNYHPGPSPPRLLGPDLIAAPTSAQLRSPLPI